MAKAGGAGGGRRIGRRLLMLAAIGGAAWFAVEGGEYTTFDLFSQRNRRARIEDDIAVLQKSVDSLVKWKKMIQTDPAVQERIAREEFGMVRGQKELLYRFVDTSSSARK